MLRQYLLAAAGVAYVLTFGYGYYLGGAHERQAQAATVSQARAEALRAAELASRKEAERLAAEAEQERLINELQQMALETPAAGDSLSVERVRRLNRY